jgi:4-diphosphocytidyl-2-C-methyl-D-erythritol kinase
MRCLDQQARARMTGTGATVFAAFDTQAQAESVLGQMPEQYQGIVTRGTNRSPLLDRNR